MMSKFWLYLGILLACSGIGTGLGIFLIILVCLGQILEEQLTAMHVPNNIE